MRWGSRGHRSIGRGTGRIMGARRHGSIGEWGHGGAGVWGHGGTGAWGYKAGRSVEKQGSVGGDWETKKVDIFFSVLSSVLLFFLT